MGIITEHNGSVKYQDTIGETTFIYALCDPDTNQVRYIGKADDPTRRLKRHLAFHESRSTHKTNWIQSLLNVDKTPTLRILEEVLKDGWQTAEKKWIEYYKMQGITLTNTTEGGIGGATSIKPVLSDEERHRRSTRAKKRMTALWAEIKAEREGEFISQEAKP